VCRRVGPEGERAWRGRRGLVRTGGRPLGVVLAADGDLIVANADIVS
jgi:hypothetical protein